MPQDRSSDSDMSSSEEEMHNQNNNDSPARESSHAPKGNKKTKKSRGRDDVQVRGNEVDGGEDAQNGDGGGKKKVGKGKAAANRMRNAGGAALGAAKGALHRTTAALGGPDVQRIGIHSVFVFSFFHFLFVLLNCTLSQLDIRGGGCLTYWGYKTNCDTTSYTVRAELLTDGKLKSCLRAGAAFSIFSVLLSASTVGVSWLLCCKLRAVIRAGRRVHLRRQRRLAQQQRRGGGGNGLTDLDAHDNHAYETSPGHANAGGKNPNANVPQFLPGLLKWIAIAVITGSAVCELICWAIIAGLYSARKTVLITTNNDLYYVVPGSEITVYLGTTATTRNVTYGVGFGLGLTAWIIEVIVLVLFAVLI